MVTVALGSGRQSTHTAVPGTGGVQGRRGRCQGWQDARTGQLAGGQAGALPRGHGEQRSLLRGGRGRASVQGHRPPMHQEGAGGARLGAAKSEAPEAAGSAAVRAAGHRGVGDARKER